MAHVFWNSA